MLKKREVGEDEYYTKFDGINYHSIGEYNVVWVSRSYYPSTRM